MTKRKEGEKIAPQSKATVERKPTTRKRKAPAKKKGKPAPKKPKPSPGPAASSCPPCPAGESVATDSKVPVTENCGCPAPDAAVGAHANAHQQMTSPEAQPIEVPLEDGLAGVKLLSQEEKQTKRKVAASRSRKRTSTKREPQSSSTPWLIAGGLLLMAFMGSNRSRVGSSAEDAVVIPVTPGE